MKNSMSLQLQMISLEATSGESALKSAIARLPQYFATVKSFFSDHIGVPLTSIFTRKDLTWFAQKAAKLNYAQIRTLPVPVPPGLKVDYVKYTQALVNAASHAVHVRTAVLAPFIQWLADNLANPANLASKAPATALDTAASRKLQQHASKLMESCFDGLRPVATQPLEKVIHRMADWSMVTDGALQLQATFAKDDHVQIAAEVRRCSDLIDQLILRIKEDPATYHTSGQTIAALTKAAYNVAQEVEFYGLVRYQVLQHQTALAGIVAKLKPMF